MISAIGQAPMPIGVASFTGTRAPFMATKKVLASARRSETGSFPSKGVTRMRNCFSLDVAAI